MTESTQAILITAVRNGFLVSQAVGGTIEAPLGGALPWDRLVATSWEELHEMVEATLATPSDLNTPRAGLIIGDVERLWIDQKLAAIEAWVDAGGMPEELVDALKANVADVRRLVGLPELTEPPIVDDIVVGEPEPPA